MKSVDIAVVGMFDLKGRDLASGTTDEILEKLNLAVHDLVADSSLVAAAIEAAKKSAEAKPRIEELFEEYESAWKVYADLMLEKRNKFACGKCEKPGEVKERTFWRIYQKGKNILLDDSKISDNEFSEYPRFVLPICLDCSKEIRSFALKEEKEKDQLATELSNLIKKDEHFGPVRTPRDKDTKEKIKQRIQSVQQKIKKSSLVREVEIDLDTKIGFRYVNDKKMVTDDRYYPSMEVYHRLANRLSIGLPPFLIREGDGGYQITIKTMMTV